MKKLINSLIILTAISLTVAAQQTTKNDFSKMSFAVGLDKKAYLLLEPIVIKFEFFNQTGEVLRITDVPNFLTDSKMKVKFRGETKEFDRLTTNTGRPQALPGSLRVFQPSQSYTEEKMLQSGLELYFPAPGDYQIQFVLSSPDGKNKTITSNTVDVTIENPTGVDREAFDFLRKYNNGTLFHWVGTEENGVPLLEEFVNKYDESVYGDLAVFQLAFVYLNKGELDKAQTEFEKIKFSSNVILAKDTKQFLLEIDNKRDYLQKKKQPE